MNGRPPVVVIAGIGNPFRRDDGVGIAVVRRLRGRVPRGVSLSEHSGEGAALIEVWNGAETAILVDAVQSGAPAGTIHRLNAALEVVPRGWFHCSTHAFGVAEAIEVARALGGLPPRLFVIGIEGKDFSAGVGLSAEVEQAAAALVNEWLQ